MVIFGFRKFQLVVLAVSIALLTGSAGADGPDILEGTYDYYCEENREDPDNSTIKPCLWFVSHGNVNGPILLFLHGFGANLSTWIDVVPALEKDFHLILIDLKGHGRSPKGRPGIYTLSEQVQRVKEIIDSLGRTVTIVAHSYGAAVSTALLTHHPQLVERLIVVSGLLYPAKIPGFIQLMQTPVVGIWGMRLIPRRLQVKMMLKSLYAPGTHISDKRIDSYTFPLKSLTSNYVLREISKTFDISVNNFSKSVHCDTYCMTAEGRDALICNTCFYKGFQVPILAIWGDQDRIFPPSHMNRFLAEVSPQDTDKSPKGCLLTGVGHIPHEESPRIFSAAVRDFVYINDSNSFDNPSARRSGNESCE